MGKLCPHENPRLCLGPNTCWGHFPLMLFSFFALSDKSRGCSSDRAKSETKKETACGEKIIKEKQMDIKIRDVNILVVKRIDELAKKKGISREEYLRRYLNKMVFAPETAEVEGQFTIMLEKVAVCIRSQQEQLSELQDSLLRIEELLEEREEE